MTDLEILNNVITSIASVATTETLSEDAKLDIIDTIAYIALGSDDTEDENTPVIPDVDTHYANYTGFFGEQPVDDSLNSTNDPKVMHFGSFDELMSFLTKGVVHQNG